MTLCVVQFYAREIVFCVLLRNKVDYFIVSLPPIGRLFKFSRYVFSLRPCVGRPRSTAFVYRMGNEQITFFNHPMISLRNRRFRLNTVERRRIITLLNCISSKSIFDFGHGKARLAVMFSLPHLPIRQRMSEVAIRSKSPSFPI